MSIPGKHISEVACSLPRAGNFFPMYMYVTAGSWYLLLLLRYVYTYEYIWIGSILEVSRTNAVVSLRGEVNAVHAADL